MPRSSPGFEPPPHVEVERFTPSELPGVVGARFRSHGHLFRSEKDRVATTLDLKGRSEWTACGRLWRGQPGGIQLKIPGEPHHELRRDGPARFQVLLFSDVLLAEAAAALGRPFVAPARLQLDPGDPAAAPHVRLHAMILAGTTDSLLLQTSLTEALQAMFPPVRSRESCGSGRRSGAVRRALVLLRERTTEPLSLEVLAAHARLDKYHLCRAFRAELGLPPHAYLTHLRVGRARELLAAGVPASEVAVQVGFYDQSQLNRHFRRIVGVTPGRYARSVL